MRNTARFRIIRNIGLVESRDSVTFRSVTASYGRRVSGEWEDDTHWNRIALFGKPKERAGKICEDDLVHI